MENRPQRADLEFHKGGQWFNPHREPSGVINRLEWESPMLLITNILFVPLFLSQLINYYEQWKSSELMHMMTDFYEMLSSLLCMECGFGAEALLRVLVTHCLQQVSLI